MEEKTTVTHQPQLPAASTPAFRRGGKAQRLEGEVNWGSPVARDPVLTQPGLGVTTTTITTITQTGGNWSSGLLDVCGDRTTCVLGSVMPCCLELSLAHLYGECTCLPLLPGSTFALRVGMRERYKIRGQTKSFRDGRKAGGKTHAPEDLVNKTVSKEHETSVTMEELQRKLNQRYEGTKPRKVRFKLASSYSGRVLKHVYEDGQELDSPEEKYPHSFVHRKIPPSHLEMEQLCGFQDTQEDQQGIYPPTGLIAQRINVYRGMGGYKPAAGPAEEAMGDSNSSVLDFGKIIIYTSNLRIIRAPQKKPDTMRHHSLPPAEAEGRPKARERSGKRRVKALSAQEGEETEKKQISDTDTKEADSCQHCGGSGCAPCSLCHGSKLSMLANRFNESISDLRCQACYPHGLEKCQSCSSK